MKIIKWIVLPIFWLGALYLGIALTLIFWPANAPFSEHPITAEQYRGIQQFSGVDFSQDVAFTDISFAMRDGVQIKAQKYSPGATETADAPSEVTLLDDPNAIIVFLHGVASQSARLNRTAGLIMQATGATVITPDLRGHGSSGGKSFDVDYIGQYEDDLAEIVKALRSEYPQVPIVISGHSMGGGIALRYALLSDAPKVDAYLLFAPNMGDGPTRPDVTQVDPEAAKLASAFINFNTKRFIGILMTNIVGIHAFDHHVIMAFNAPPEMPRYTYSAIASAQPNAPQDSTIALQAIDAPLLVLVGENDEAFVASAYPKLVSENSEGETVIMPDLNHNQILNSDQITNVIADWYGPFRAPEATAAEAEGSFWDISYLEHAFIDTTPADRKDGISVGELGVDGGEQTAALQLAKEIAEGKHGLYDSLLVSHKGQLLFESYYRRGRIDLAGEQASAVKAYTSLALGRAIQLGYLTMADLDKPLISFFDNLDREKFVEGAERITLKKALTMHGGLSVSEEKWEELQQNPDAIQRQHFIQALFEHSEPITAESQTYSYGNFNPPMVMAVIDAVAPGTAQDFIKTEILDKLGITNYLWSDSITGLPEAGWRVSLTSRDMLKLGSVVLNEGRWNGEQLIPVDYLTTATSGLVKPTQDWMPDSFRYGYFWYQTSLTVGDKSYDTTFAWGGGGQRVIVVKDLELVIVITGHDPEDDTIMTEVSEAILPNFAQ